MKYVIIMALFLSGCAQVGILADKAKDTADSAAQIQLRVPCAMTAGAFVRLPRLQRSVTEPFLEVVCP